MSYLVIDTSTAASSLFFDQLTQLDGREYLLRFVWHDRTSQWKLGIYDQDENLLVPGVGLKVTWPLLRRFRDARLPPGLLMCVDQSGQDSDVESPEELGQRVMLLYITSDDPDIQPGGQFASLVGQANG
jgi:hypothetical protein